MLVQMYLSLKATRESTIKWGQLIIIIRISIAGLSRV